MLHFARTCDAIASTSKKLEKTALVADYLRALFLNEAAIATIFLSGRPFAAFDEATLQVGGALLWRAIGELSGRSEHELTEIYRKHGDAGSVAAEALPGRTEAVLSLLEVQHAFSEIAVARGPAAKAHLLLQLLERSTPLEAKYIVKIIGGDLRIGLKESLVEEAIARAFEAPLEQVKRANMLLGDLGATLRLASAGKLAEARLRLFHPIDFMLASPVASSGEALSYFENVAVEDKYDGIRAQAHISQSEVRIFSRTRDEITESFPELPLALAGLPKDAILDGETLPGARVARALLPAKAERSPSARSSSVSAARTSATRPCATSPWPIWFSTSSTPTANFFSTAPFASARRFLMSFSLPHAPRSFASLKHSRDSLSKIQMRALSPQCSGRRSRPPPLRKTSKPSSPPPATVATRA
ncbi:MAG: hypothetical protein LAO22_09535 [Acidobacteriia bacterium]|nr:hypothetical protein [Terriglobia bacterium]